VGRAPGHAEIAETADHECKTVPSDAPTSKNARAGGAEGGTAAVKNTGLPDYTTSRRISGTPSSWLRAHHIAGAWGSSVQVSSRRRYRFATMVWSFLPQGLKRKQCGPVVTTKPRRRTWTPYRWLIIDTNPRTGGGRGQPYAVERHSRPSPKGIRIRENGQRA